MATDTKARYRDALAQRDFRLLLSAFTVDAVGGWAYNVVLIVYVFDRTHSTNWIVATTASSWIPRALTSTYAGAVADRIERTLVMIASAMAAFVAMSLVALLVAVDAAIPLILLLSAVTSVCAAFNSPAARALMPEVVEEKDLVSANALFGLIENLVIVVGPAIGGLMLLSDERA